MLLYLWQLPQNLIGLLVIICTRAVKHSGYYATRKYSNLFTGVSLGKYIILSLPYNSNNIINHEKGHQKQSLYLGWLYLLIIGSPSFLGNIYDRIFHKNWTTLKRISWYYNQPWEKWADKLGGVKRYEY